MLPSNSVGFNEDMNESGIIARTLPATGRSLSEWTQTRAGLASLPTGSQPVRVCARCEQRYVTVGMHAPRVFLRFTVSRSVRFFFASAQLFCIVHNVFSPRLLVGCGNSPPARCAECVFLSMNSTTSES